eukprot:m.62864 g.62864  ORF g.62864 m.62864 type:complete len:268 (+) comp12436_c1_seq2:62-865(+)
MSFSFNFGASAELPAASREPMREEVSRAPFEELGVQEAQQQTQFVPHTFASGLTMKFAAPQDGAIDHKDATRSDLIPGVYEGGFKLWECAVDLVDFMAREVGGGSSLAGKRVLELGCGVAAPGVFALLQGAHVDFQDYNREVVLHATMPTVLANCTAEQVSRARFFSGDWAEMLKAADRLPKYDVILTAETIYEPQHNATLLALLLALLAPQGAILLAAKTYYFGVGGSLRAFEARVAADPRVATRRVFQHAAGVNREIIQIAFIAK